MKLSLITLSINHFLYLLIGVFFYFDINGISSVSDGINNFFFVLMILPIHLSIEVIGLLALIISLARAKAKVQDDKVLLGVFGVSLVAVIVATMNA
jgi:hypothetical protein